LLPKVGYLTGTTSYQRVSSYTPILQKFTFRD
jgi:hypothetical protein